MTLENETQRLNLVGRPDGLTTAQTGPLSDGEVLEIEEHIGFELPADYREFLAINGGARGLDVLGVQVGRRVRSFADGWFYGSALTIGEMTQSVADRYGEGLVEDGALIDPEWGSFLVPFAGRAQELWYCFDFSCDEAPVIQVDAEGDWQRSTSFDGLRYVADSFSEFLSLMSYEPTLEQRRMDREPRSSVGQHQWESRLRSWLGL